MNEHDEESKIKYPAELGGNAESLKKTLDEREAKVRAKEARIKASLFKSRQKSSSNQDTK